MSALDGFKAFDFNEGVPYASITRNGIAFNKSVVMKLGFPSYVQFLIDDKTQRIALHVSEETEPNAVAFYKKRSSKVISVRWNGKDLLKTLSAMMQWNLEEESYRVEGELIPEEDAIIFDLRNAVALN